MRSKTLAWRVVSSTILLLPEPVNLGFHRNSIWTTQGGAKVGLQLWVWETEFTLVLLVINYCIIFHVNNYKPTSAPPCISQDRAHLLQGVTSQLVSKWSPQQVIPSLFPVSGLWMEDIIQGLLVRVPAGVGIFRLWAHLESSSTPFSTIF